MLVKLKAMIKASGQWRQPGESVELPDTEARRLIELGAAEAAAGAETAAATPASAELDAMRAEIARLQEFERQQLAAAAEAEAKAQAAKGGGKAGAKE